MTNCVVTGGSKNDVAPIGTLLLNLRETQSWIDQVIIYHDGISEKDQLIMKSILPVEFIRYRFPGNPKKFNEIIKYYYSEMVFCKYECFKLLERFENVLWTDYDVLFLKDVSELLSPCAAGIRSLMYSPEHPVGILRRQLRYGCESKLEHLFDLDMVSVATGLFLVNRQLPQASRLHQESIELTEQYGNCLCLPEQAIFDMLFQRYGIIPESIPWTYAAHPIHDASKLPEAKILHCYAQPKFWNGLHNEQWDALYREWLQMGGSPWKISFSDRLKQLKRSIVFRFGRILGRA